MKEDIFKEQERRIKAFNKRLKNTQILFLVFVVGLIIHLFCFQIIDFKHYRMKAREQQACYPYTLRGDIYDRNGIKLATDTIYYDIFARPKDFNDKIRKKEDIAKALAPILKMQPKVLCDKLEKGKNNPVILLKKHATKDEYKEIVKLEFREIPIDKIRIRTYPQGALAAHVLGYYNDEANTSAGVEYTAKDKLEHVENFKKIQATPSGRFIFNFSTNPVALTQKAKGEDITLTLDAAIQHICEKELNHTMAKFKAEHGTIIVMNPRNGEILAYAVAPNYNPNNFRTATYEQIKNWTLTDIFPPGSTFKAITAASAIELGKINKDTKIYDSGMLKIDKWKIENHDYRQKGAPGMVDLVHFFLHSSNIVAVKIALMMSANEFHSMAKKFGLGAKTGIDLPGESIGLLNSPQRWSTSDRASMGYGYGASVTAIQLASAISAIANNGVKVTPHVVKYSEEDLAKKVKSVEVITPETAKTVTDLLVKATEQEDIRLENYYVAAKTGTSKKVGRNGRYMDGMYYTSTVGYFPATDPQVLVYVVIDSPKSDAGVPIFGSTVAGPVFKTVSAQVASILNLKPDKHK